MANSSIVRYSDADLEEFRQLIVDRYQKAKAELDDLRSQIVDISESLEGDFGTDYIDDSSSVNNLEMLNNMAIRKRKYLQDLENAMIRIRNKTYGICSVTGELIDRKRLLAVPTTTKSVQGKTLQTGGFTSNPNTLKQQEEAEETEDDTPKSKKKQPKTPKIISRVIRKTNTKGPVKPAAPIEEEEEEEEDLDDMDDDLFNDLRKVNLDDVADEAEDVADESAANFFDEEGGEDDDEN